MEKISASEKQHFIEFAVDSRKKIIFIDKEKLEELTGFFVFLEDEEVKRAMADEGTWKFCLVLSDLNDPFDSGQARKCWYKNPNSVRLNFKKFCSCKKLIGPRKSNEEIQRETVKTLAHEIRHLFQAYKKRNRLAAFLERLSFNYKIFFFSSCALSLYIAFHSVLEEKMRQFFFFGPDFLLAILVLFFLMFFAGDICYFFDPCERDARDFEKKAINDKEWSKTVQVYDI